MILSGSGMSHTLACNMKSWVRHGTSPLTAMADTKRDDPDASSIAREEESHEMRALPAEVQFARGDLPVIPDPGEAGGESHDCARASSLQTKGPCDDDGTTPHWSDLANVVAPRDPEEDRDAAHAPIMCQGLPSFAQSEFSTVCLIFIFPTTVVVLIMSRIPSI